MYPDPLHEHMNMQRSECCFVNICTLVGYSLFITDYIITQVILAYDLLEDRCTIDIIISKFFPLCFKMVESFENLDAVLRDWAKDKVQKVFAEALNRYEKKTEER